MSDLLKGYSIWSSVLQHTTGAIYSSSLSSPWFNADIAEGKRCCSQLEQWWKSLLRVMSRNLETNAKLSVIDFFNQVQLFNVSGLWLPLGGGWSCLTTTQGPAPPGSIFSSALIIYKHCWLTFWALLDLYCHDYLAILVQRSTTNERRALLRSGHWVQLLILPSPKTSKFGERSFACEHPILWNYLPENITKADSVSLFIRNLKTHLLSIGYWHVLKCTCCKP